MIAKKCENEAERLEALYRYGILDSPRNPAFDDITKLVSRVCDAPIAIVNLIDANRQFFMSEVGVGVRQVPLESSLCAHAILQRGIMIVPDTLEDPRFVDNPLVTGDPSLRFYAGSLLETDDGYPIGTLCVLDFKPRTLTDEQTEILRVLSHEVMARLELHRKVMELQATIARQRETEERLRAMHERESRIAETLQRSMLIAPRDDSFDGISVKLAYQAALDEALVGGDFFDAFKLNDRTIALVVGDVSGKGLAAAARTVEVKYALRAYLHSVLSPAYAISQVNEFLCHKHNDTSLEGFIAMSLVTVDTVSGEAFFASAGAEPTLVLKANGTVETVHDPCQPLGITMANYEAVPYKLERGDTIIMFTDGLSEARAGADFLEVEGLARIAIAAGPAASLDALSDAILGAAKAHSQGVLRDDACLLLARLK